MICGAPSVRFLEINYWVRQLLLTLKGANSLGLSLGDVMRPLRMAPELLIPSKPLEKQLLAQSMSPGWQSALSMDGRSPSFPVLCRS